MAIPGSQGRNAVYQHRDLSYGLVAAVDIENFSRANTLGQVLLQKRLSRVLDIAARRARLDRASWYCQPRGDGELAVLPHGVRVATVLADFTDRLVEALAQSTMTYLDGPRLRIRVAMHHGTLAPGAFGPAGDAPIVACRLLDAAAARAALRANPTANLVLVISDRLYQDVIQTRFNGLEPARFRPIRTTAKGATYCGYLCVGTPRDPGATQLRPAAGQ